MEFLRRQMRMLFKLLQFTVGWPCITQSCTKIRRSEQKYKVALEVLSYHNQASDDELDQYLRRPLPPPSHTFDLIKYECSPWAIPMNDKPLYVIHMFKELFKDMRKEHKERCDISVMYRFTLTVRKNYRQVPYHNWEHGFSVAHAMYTVLKTTKHKFTALESVTMYVACLCHDLDHRGYTNQFMVKTGQPLAAMYSTSTMEHHHFNHCVTILQNDGHNIFKYLSSEEYKQVLGDIRHCILATDLALFFGNRAELKELHENKMFDWERKDHKQKLMALCMTASDLCSMYKPWDLQLELVQVIMEEFWLQGDEEKKIGQTPIPMMDRTKSDQLPSSQVGFIVGICLPCYELLADMLPETRPMVTGAQKNLKRWKELAERQKHGGQDEPLGRTTGTGKGKTRKT